jgi:hypothetical protein
MFIVKQIIRKSWIITVNKVLAADLNSRSGIWSSSTFKRSSKVFEFRIPCEAKTISPAKADNQHDCLPRLLNDGGLMKWKGVREKNNTLYWAD